MDDAKLDLISLDKIWILPYRRDKQQNMNKSHKFNLERFIALPS
ncbi:hypothetical protein HanXRQr2_Chr16g0727281 [Helianthus annuus]|uniref:Uncharacterized protein n=1 Tax=Helianthus annuus TaxID=4232 RepID=A0A9K3GX68_HELAN|nr:hypothetical protein HanXRQr2_Chr16g0727281 [Helianthus annuus]